MPNNQYKNAPVTLQRSRYNAFVYSQHFLSVLVNCDDDFLFIPSFLAVHLGRGSESVCD